MRAAKVLTASLAVSLCWRPRRRSRRLPNNRGACWWVSRPAAASTSRRVRGRQIDRAMGPAARRRTTVPAPAAPSHRYAAKAPRRLLAALLRHLVARRRAVAVQAAAVRPLSRFRAGIHDRHHAQRARHQPDGAGEIGRRIHRLHQGEQRQNRHRPSRRGQLAAHDAGAVPPDHRRQRRAGALQRRRAGAGRFARRPYSRHVRQHVDAAVGHQIGQNARARITSPSAPPTCPTCRP